MNRLDASDELRAAIAASDDGALRFDEFMRLALYGEHGFYTAREGGGRAGRRGDFLTAPEVGPLFGVLVARYLDGEWDRIGQPDPFVVVDAGAGPGTLARSVLAAAPRCRDALAYVAVERSAGQRAEHPAGVESRETIPSAPFDGVVLAVELLDNLPFRLAVFDEAWREAFVVTAGDDFAEILSAPLSPVPPELPSRAAHGARAPLCAEAAIWVEATRRLIRRGSLLVVDYARPTAALAALAWRDWLRTYRGHERGGHYLRHPGAQDVTADVAIDQLPSPYWMSTQAEFLHRLGIDELVAQGRATWTEAAAYPDIHAMTMRSRVREAEALLDPAGLGAFTVAEWRGAADRSP